MKASENLVRILVDCTQPGSNEDLLRKFQVRGFPTVLFLDSEGNPLEAERREGRCTKCPARYVLRDADAEPGPCSRCGEPVKAETLKAPVQLAGRDAASVRRKFEEVASAFARTPRWRPSLEAALEAARAESKPVGLFFFENKPASDGYAAALEDKSLEDLFEKIVFVKLDVRSSAADARRFNVTSPPIIYVFDPDEARPEIRPLGKIYGRKTARDLRRDLEAALRKHEKK